MSINVSASARVCGSSVYRLSSGMRMSSMIAPSDKPIVTKIACKVLVYSRTFAMFPSPTVLPVMTDAADDAP